MLRDIFLAFNSFSVRFAQLGLRSPERWLTGSKLRFRERGPIPEATPLPV
jgi:hypothetical protein